MVAIRALINSKPFYFNLFLFFAGFLIYSFNAVNLFDSIPRMDDSVSALFSTKTFFEGRLFNPLPPRTFLFNMFGIISGWHDLPHFMGAYPPAHPVALLVGQFFGAPYLVNPVLGGALLVSINNLGKRMFHTRVGQVAALLFLLSPFAGVINATHLSHTLTALSLVIGFNLFLKYYKRINIASSVVIGSAFSVALLSRPATALILVALFFTYLYTKCGNLRLLFKRGRVVLFLFILSGISLMNYQKIMTGSPFKIGQQIVLKNWGVYGFHDFGEYEQHGPHLHPKLKEHFLKEKIDDNRAFYKKSFGIIDSIKHSGARVYQINSKLFGPLLPAILLSVIALFYFRFKRRYLFLAAPFVLLLLFYGGFWYFEEYFPGRYLYSALPFLTILVAAFLVSFFIKVRKHKKMKFILFGIALALVVNIFIYTPFYQKKFTTDYGDVETILHRVVHSYKIKNSLVFMESIGAHSRDWDRYNNYYASGFMLNDLLLKGDVLFVNNDVWIENDGTVSDYREYAIEKYPNRDYYLYLFDRRVNRSWLYKMMTKDNRPIRLLPVVPHDKLLLYDGKQFELNKI